MRILRQEWWQNPHDRLCRGFGVRNDAIGCTILAGEKPSQSIVRIVPFAKLSVTKNQDF
jgi:hypothetical protein